MILLEASKIGGAQHRRDRFLRFEPESTAYPAFLGPLSAQHAIFPVSNTKQALMYKWVLRRPPCCRYLTFPKNTPLKCGVRYTWCPNENPPTYPLRLGSGWYGIWSTARVFQRMGKRGRASWLLYDVKPVRDVSVQAAVVHIYREMKHVEYLVCM